MDRTYIGSSEHKKDLSIIKQRKEYTMLTTVEKIDITQCGGYNPITGEYNCL